MFFFLNSEYYICDTKCDIESPGEENCKQLLSTTDMRNMPMGTNKGTSMHYESPDGSF